MSNYLNITPMEGTQGVVPSIVSTTEDNKGRYDRDADILFSYQGNVYATLKVTQLSFGEILSIIDSNKIRVNDDFDTYLYGRSNAKQLSILLAQDFPLSLKTFEIYDGENWISISNGLEIPEDPGSKSIYLYRASFTSTVLYDKEYVNYVSNDVDKSLPFIAVPSRSSFSKRYTSLTAGISSYIYGKSNSHSLSIMDEYPGFFIINSMEVRTKDSWESVKLGKSMEIPNDPGQYGDLYDFRLSVTYIGVEERKTDLVLFDNAGRECDRITLVGDIQLDDKNFIFYDENNIIIGRGVCPFVSEESKIQYLIENFARNRDLGRNPNGINKCEYDNAGYDEPTHTSLVYELLTSNAPIVTDVYKDFEEGRTFKGINFVTIGANAGRYFIIRMPFGTHRVVSDIFDVSFGNDSEGNPVTSLTTSYILLISSSADSLTIGQGMATTVSYLIAQDLDELMSTTYLANYQKFLQDFSPINPKEHIAKLPTSQTVYSATNYAVIHTYEDSNKYGDIVTYHGVSYICVAPYTLDKNYEQSEDWIQYEDI